MTEKTPSWRTSALPAEEAADDRPQGRTSVRVARAILLAANRFEFPKGACVASLRR